MNKKPQENTKRTPEENKIKSGAFSVKKYHFTHRFKTFEELLNYVKSNSQYYSR